MGDKQRLRERQVEAAETQVAVLAEFVTLLQAREKVRKHKELDEACCSSPSRLFHGAQGSRTLAKFPGFAALWDLTVPESHLLRTKGRDYQVHTILLCPCGAQTVLDAVPLTQCAGLCGRWLFVGRKTVFAHRFDRQSEE